MIARFLCFPDDAQVLGAFYSTDTGCWDIAIDHPSLPATKEGQRYRRVKPRYKSEERDGELWVCFEGFDVEPESGGEKK